MKKIKKYVEQVEDELKSAKCYAEKALEFKSINDSTWYNKYKKMANDELEHAMTIHENAMNEIEVLNRVFTPTVEMQDKWDKEHERFVQESTWIRTMLSM